MFGKLLHLIKHQACHKFCTFAFSCSGMFFNQFDLRSLWKMWLMTRTLPDENSQIAL